MSSLKEWFNPSRVISQMGALKFQTSIFKDEIRFPHWEMDRALQLYEQRPQVNSGVKQLVRFIVGGVITAKSDDEKSKEFLDKWLKLRPTFRGEVVNFVTSAVVSGNAYLEPSFVQTQNGITIVDNVFCVNDPSRIYYNLDTRKTDDEFWLYEVPIEVKMFPFQGQEYKPRFWRVNYIRGSILFQRMVYAIPVHKTKLRHFKTGWSRDGMYGRGFVSACVDDGEILLEILKNLAIISRTRALNTKIVSIGTEEDRASPADLNKLDFDLKNRRENEHILINKPVSSIDLSHQGKYDKMDSTLEYMRKELASGLVPNFITPWNEDANKATASEIKIPFQLELTSWKEDLIQSLNEIILTGLRQAYPWLADDLSFDFGVIDLTSQEERMRYAGQMFNDNTITLNEYRQAAGYEVVEGGDIWGYKLPSLPLDQQRATQKDSPGQMGAPIQDEQPAQSNKFPSEGYRPAFQLKKKAKSNINLKEIPRPMFSERTKGGFATEEEIGTAQDFEEVFSEMYKEATTVNQLMKKFKIGSLIKTQSGRGTNLSLLQKGDKKEVIDIIKDSLSKSLLLDKSNADFRKEVKKQIQEYRDGDPKYDKKIIERIARTELSRIREAHNLLQMREQGFTKVQHITHVSPNSGKKDLMFNKKVFEIEHLLSDKGESDRIPLHPNCRCSYAPHK